MGDKSPDFVEKDNGGLASFLQRFTSNYIIRQKGIRSAIDSD